MVLVIVVVMQLDLRLRRYVLRMQPHVLLTVVVDLIQCLAGFVCHGIQAALIVVPHNKQALPQRVLILKYIANPVVGAKPLEHLWAVGLLLASVLHTAQT